MIKSLRFPRLGVAVEFGTMRGQTPFGIFQNVIPREWPDMWYVYLHVGTARLGIYNIKS